MARFAICAMWEVLRAAIFYGSSKVGYIFEKGGANNTTNQNYYEEASGGLKNMLFAPPPTSHVGTSRGAKGGVQGGGANYMTQQALQKSGGGI